MNIGRLSQPPNSVPRTQLHGGYLRIHFVRTRIHQTLVFWEDFLHNQFRATRCLLYISLPTIPIKNPWYLNSKNISAADLPDFMALSRFFAFRRSFLAFRRSFLTFHRFRLFERLADIFRNFKQPPTRHDIGTFSKWPPQGLQARSSLILDEYLYPCKEPWKYLLYDWLFRQNQPMTEGNLNL